MKRKKEDVEITIHVPVPAEAPTIRFRNAEAEDITVDGKAAIKVTGLIDDKRVDIITIQEQ